MRRPPRRDLPRRARYRFALIVVTAALAFALVASACARRREALPVYGKMPAFELVNQSGRAVRSAELAGKVVLVNFIYTNCPDVCPTLTVQMRKVQERLREARLLGDPVILISISVDPERDDPAVLRDYAARYKADTTTWSFLTGSTAQVRQVVVDGFKLGYEPAGAGGAHGSGHDANLIVHSDRFVLVDKAGQIRAYYRGEELDPAKIAADARSLAGANGGG